ncbi:MAG: NUDIX domain-containing protein [bacterium]|nr:NUDIX domain-containing protein [bacterium]
MKKVAAIILENSKREILLLLRDDNPNIAYPNQWDLIGGFVNGAETVEQALKRELKEETDYNVEEVKEVTYWKEYSGAKTDSEPNKKFIYKGTILSPEKIQLGDEGQELRFFSHKEILTLPLASKHREILKDYINEFFVV